MKTLYLKLISYSSTVIAPVVLAFITWFPNKWVFLSLVIVWFVYFGFVFLRLKRDINQAALHAMTALSFIILLVLTEAALLRWFFVLASGIVFFFIAFWSEPRIDHAIHIKEKPLRRMMMMLYVFNVYAFLVGLFAWHLYFPMMTFFVMSILGAVYAALGAHMIWRLYYKKNNMNLMIWTGVVGAAIFELMWVMKLMPFGYLVLGFLIAWLWYIIQLFVRFHLSIRGIVWRKQVHFILGNLLLFILVLYLIRWI